MSNLGRGTAVPFAVAALGIATFAGMDVFMKGLSIAIGTYNAILWRTLIALLIVAAPASALPFVSFQIAGTVAGQSQEVTLDVSGTVNETHKGNSGIVMYGGEAGVGLPAGFHVFGHYYRHTNEFGEELVQETTGVHAYVDMAGNEWGLDLEWHLGLIPGSPLKPFLGAGGSWARVNLDGKVRYETESAAKTQQG